MRNNLTLIALVVGAIALYVMWETLTARIVAVESATGSYIYGDRAVPEEIVPSTPPPPPPTTLNVDLEALNARLGTLEGLIGANAKAIDTVLQRLEQIENTEKKTVSRVRNRETVLFAHDDSRLAPDELVKIDKVLAGIDEDAIVSLRGHADTTGDNRHNYYLSIRRAAAVKRYMEEKLEAEGRIDAMLITIDGIGEEGVVNLTADGVEEPANRIVEILVFDRAVDQ
jgi:outer membrane protein OmpA-like peptidoglycan-associated protein